jgi:hypothetical protein
VGMIDYETIQNYIKNHNSDDIDDDTFKLSIYNKTVNNWLKAEANKIDQKEFLIYESLVTELDEMHLYLGKKKTTYGSG